MINWNMDEVNAAYVEYLTGAATRDRYAEYLKVLDRVMAERDDAIAQEATR